MRYYWIKQEDPVFLDRESGLVLQNNNGEKGSEPSISQFRLSEDNMNTLWQMKPLARQAGFHYHKGEQNIETFFSWDSMLHYAVGDDFIAVIYSNESVTWLLDKTTGKQIGKIPLNVPRRPTTPEDRKRIESEFGKSLTRQFGMHIQQPEFWPTVKDLQVDGLGNIWTILSPSNDWKTWPYRVYSKEGKKLKHGSFSETPPKLIAGDAIFYYTSKDDEIFFIKRKIR